MKLGVLFSGGKDSALALYKAMEKSNVVCLVSILSKNPASYMFHTPNIDITKMQAKSIGLPLIQKITKGEKETELEDLKKALQDAKTKYKIQGVVTGAVESVYQATRIQKICDELNLLCYNPLWKMDQEKLLDEVIKNNFEVVISGIFAYPLTKNWLGKKINRTVVWDLVNLRDKYNISPSGEGGEIETTVLNAPFFKQRIVFEEFSIEAEENSGVMHIKNPVLKEKK